MRRYQSEMIVPKDRKSRNVSPNPAALASGVAALDLNSRGPTTSGAHMDGGGGLTHPAVRLLEAVIEHPGMEAVAFLVRVLAESKEDKDRDEEAAQSLLYFFEARDRGLSLSRFLVTHTLNTSIRISELFRGNDLATRVLVEFIKLSGFHYLIETLAPMYAQEFIEKPFHSFEVEESVIRKSLQPNENYEAISAANHAAIMSACRVFCTAIVSSVESMPVTLRSLFAHIRAEIERVYEGKGLSTTSGFIFLRFFTPILCMPHKYCLLPGISSPELNRNLVLLSKVLQIVANNSDRKSVFLTPDLDAFVQEIRPSILDFIERITTAPPSPLLRPIDVIPPIASFDSVGEYSYASSSAVSTPSNRSPATTLLRLAVPAGAGATARELPPGRGFQVPTFLARTALRCLLHYYYVMDLRRLTIPADFTPPQGAYAGAAKPGMSVGELPNLIADVDFILGDPSHRHAIPSGELFEEMIQSDRPARQAWLQRRLKSYFERRAGRTHVALFDLLPTPNSVASSTTAGGASDGRGGAKGIGLCVVREGDAVGIVNAAWTPEDTNDALI